jgi:hypothetical protein
MSANREKCPVDGCAGLIEFTTNGHGGLRAIPCPYCQRRAEWERRNTPVRPPKPCTICGAPVPPAEGRGSAKHRCAACEPVHRRVKVAKEGAAKRKREREKVTPITRGAA